MNHRRQALARITAAALTLAAIPSLAMAASMREQLDALINGPKGTLNVVLVDTTGSIAQEDWQLYERAMQALIDSAKPGDRIVMAAVHDRPGSRFLAHADHSFCAEGNSMQQAVRARRTREAMRTDLVALRSAHSRPALATLLIDAVSATGELFAQGRARGQALRLLVLSDMLEEGPTANFARGEVTPALAERVIERQRRRTLLPDLAGVRVRVVGASGRDAAHMASVRGFWQSFFAASGAQVEAYGRTAGALAH